jgi:hypothetical protein
MLGHVEFQSDNNRTAEQAIETGAIARAARPLKHPTQAKRPLAAPKTSHIDLEPILRIELDLASPRKNKA